MAVEYGRKGERDKRNINEAEKGMKSTLAFSVNLAVTKFLIGATIVAG